MICRSWSSLTVGETLRNMTHIGAKRLHCVLRRGHRGVHKTWETGNYWWWPRQKNTASGETR